MANAKALRRAQDPKIVVDEQRGVGIEGFELDECPPELLVFLGGLKIVTGHGPLEVAAHIGLLVFERQNARVGVGDENASFVVLRQTREECLAVRSKANQVQKLSFQFTNVQPRHLVPVIEAVILERVAAFLILSLQLGTRLRQCETACSSIALGKVVAPEEVVEIEVEDRAVHVDQYGVNPGPIEHFSWPQPGEAAGSGAWRDSRTTNIPIIPGFVATRSQGMRSKPEILSVKTVGRSRLFRIEEMKLRFANGVERIYERLPATGHRAVMAVAVNDNDELLLIREYAAGFHEYQLTLPKGSAEPGESLIEATNRELMEETGFGAGRIERLRELSVAPGHMGFTISVMLARDLYAKRLPGDEPEEIEVVPWPMDRIPELVERADFTEARAIAAIFLAQQRLTGAVVR